MALLDYWIVFVSGSLTSCAQVMEWAKRQPTVEYLGYKRSKGDAYQVKLQEQMVALVQYARWCGCKTTL